MIKKYIFPLILIISIIECTSEKITIKKTGIGYSTKDETVITYKDIRKWYDKKDFEKIYDTLINVEDKNFFLDYLLIESAYNINRIKDIEPIYLKEKENKKTFFKGIVSFLNREYDKTIIYLKNLGKKEPVPAYFVGSAYLYTKDYPMAIGYLMLSVEWDMPWVYFTIANFYLIKNDIKKAYEYIKKTEDACYDFEENILLDIKIKNIEILVSEEKYEDAATLALNIYKKYPEKVILYIDPGQIYFLQGNPEKAMNFWKEALNNNEIRNSIKELIKEKISLLEKK